MTDPSGLPITPTQAEKTTLSNLALSPLPAPVFTGLKLKQDIILNNFTFNTVDDYGVLWVITNIIGWWQPPAPEMPDIKRGWDDGIYDVKGRFNARDLTLEGSILVPTSSMMPDARRRLVKAITLVRAGAWLKTNESPTKASYVRLSGEPKIETVNARGRVDFSIGLRAADPIKYSWNSADPDGYTTVAIPAKSTSPSRTGLATATNVGDYEVSCYISVLGPVTGPANIVNTTTNEAITIVGSLRGLTTKTVNTKAISNSLATIGTTAAHGLVIGDSITISGMGAPYDGVQIIDGVPTTTSFQFVISSANVSQVSASGTITYGPDLLEIDTYNRDVFLNGEFTNARLKLEVYNDWIKLQPGANALSFYDNGNANSTAALTVDFRSGWLA
jgi:hypothetical protein